MEKPTVFTVFYAWQSDTTQTHCRHLIGEALQAAADELSADATIPYRVAIDHDTLNETGLCDIPATILAKIDAADAMLVDLTYVAHTEPENGDPKSCSNPNVLFELGYGFRSMDPKRLICVMNEKHGAKSEQIFDLNHRRHAIGYTSPNDGKTRAQTVEALSKDLVNALSPIVLKHGLRSISGDGSGRHASERSQIESISNSIESRLPNRAVITCALNPQLYHDRRFADRAALSSAIQRREIRDGSVNLPLRINRAIGIPCGVFCDTESHNNDRWAMTYAGQFWLQFVIPTVADIRMRIDQAEPQSTEPPLIEAYVIAYELCNAFATLASLGNEFHEGETLEISVTGDGFRGQRLGSQNWQLFQWTHPSISPNFTRTFKVTSADFSANWTQYCTEAIKEVFDLFTNVGNSIPMNAISEMISGAIKHKFIPPR